MFKVAMLPTNKTFFSSRKLSGNTTILDPKDLSMKWDVRHGDLKLEESLDYETSF